MINAIDKSKCTGCGTCMKTCALDVFRIKTEQDCLSPCMAECPAGTDIRAYNALLQMGMLEEAAEKLKESNPFPAITGRVCPHSCESKCQRAKVDTAVNINAVEQFLGDLTLEDKPQPSHVRHVSPIAVAGSGPAGLACAWFLAKKGYPVTVFEAMPEPGGMLRYGIPAYRLPVEVMEKQVAALEALGVRFVFNTKVGAGGDISLEDIKSRGFKAVMLAPGAGCVKKPGVPGEDMPGVRYGVEFLKAARSGFPPLLSGKVLIVGGGDVAMDAALSAKKLGAAEVRVLCLEAEGAMPAFAHNIQDALNAGIAIENGWGPEQVLGEGKAKGLRVKRCLSVFDGEGRFAPVFDAADSHDLMADHIIFAIGQMADLAPFADDIDLERGRISVDSVTMNTSFWNIFAAGDAVTGPASVIKAIRGGREAALSIDRLMQGGHLHSEREEKRPLAELLPEKGILPAPRQERKRVAAQEGFAEMTQGLDSLQALQESLRCMTCGAKAEVGYRDDCMTCFFCELRCPSEAIDVHPFKERLPYTLESNTGGF